MKVTSANKIIKANIGISFVNVLFVFIVIIIDAITPLSGTLNGVMSIYQALAIFIAIDIIIWTVIYKISE